MEKAHYLIGELAKNLSNLKKSPNRKYKKITLLHKLEIAKQNYTQLLNIIENIDDKEQNFLLKSARTIFGEIRCQINLKLESTQLMSFKTIAKTILTFISLYKRNSKKMATEIIKIASALVPQYDGNGEKLNNIVSALTALKSVTNAETEPVAIQIILSKLEKKARSAVGPTPRSIEEIINKLKLKCKQQANSDVVLAKLKATKQNGSLNKFTAELEELADQLEAAYLNEEIPLNTAAKMATKAGVKALATGLKNPEAKLLIKAGQFSTLTSAIEKALEHSADQESTAPAQVLNFNRGNSNRNFYNPTNNHRNRGAYNNHTPPANFNRRNYNTNGYSNNNNFNDRRNNNPNNNRGRNNFNNNRPNNNHYANNNNNNRTTWQNGYHNNQRRIYATSAENQIPNSRQQPEQQNINNNVNNPHFLGQ